MPRALNPCRGLPRRLAQRVDDNPDEERNTTRAREAVGPQSEKHSICKEAWAETPPAQRGSGSGWWRITRTLTRTQRPPPTGLEFLLLQNAEELDLRVECSSSRRIVPPLATSNRPFVCRSRRASRGRQELALHESWRNRATVPFTSGRSLRWLRRHRARGEVLPAPVSPAIKTVDSVGATTRRSTSMSTGLLPTMSLKLCWV